MINPFQKLDLLFVAEHALWPLDQGCRLHGYQHALAAARGGARVGVACMEAARADAPRALRDLLIPWPKASSQDNDEFSRGWSGHAQWLRRRIADHQGLDPAVLAGVVALVNRHRPEAVVGVGQHSVMMLRGLSHRDDVVKIWHAADELIYFNLSCMKHEPMASLPLRLRTLALHGAIEAVFCRGIDAAVGVSPLDSKLLRRVAGASRVATVRNGVDLEYFSPRSERGASQSSDTAAHPRSIAFWGRMDFEPNIDAACWFVRRVWPALRARHPEAVMHVIGKNPHERVRQLAGEGVRVWGEVADIRQAVAEAGVAVLPMRCGGGIKNKLLEAAAMGMPIVASPQAVRGLELGIEPPLLVCGKPDRWVEAIAGLWSDARSAQTLGKNARAWVESHHSWDGASRRLLGFIAELTGVDAASRGEALRRAA